jgi:hypothetical protein
VATRRRSRRKSIAGNITDVQKRLRYLETRPAPTQLASKVVVSKNIAPRAVGQELIADSAVTRRSLVAGVVGTTQIEASAITQSLLATDSVGTAQIIQDSVTANEIAPGTITVNEMGANSVGSTQISNGSVGTDELAGGIPDSKIAGMSSSKLIGDITTDKIGNLQVTDDKIAGISGSKIIGGVQGSLIVDRSITAAKIGSGVITETELGADCVGFSELQNNAIFNDNINAGVVVGSAGVGKVNIQNFSIGSNDIFSSAITNAKLDNNAVTDRTVLSISAEKITSGVLATGRIPSITNAMLAGGITNGKISSVDAGTIITGTIGINRLPGEVLTNVSAGTGISVSGSGRSRTVSFNGSGYALSNHTHSQYASSGRYDTSFAGGHVGHGGHTHFTNISSTRKLKKEISDYSIDLDKLFLLQPKRFKYRNQARDASKNREWDYGYIAEEALELGVEEIVGYDEKGEVDSINYGLLSVFVLELVKKQQNEINLLSEEIKRLKENK